MSSWRGMIAIVRTDANAAGQDGQRQAQQRQQRQHWALLFLCNPPDVEHHAPIPFSMLALYAWRWLRTLLLQYTAMLA